MTDNKHMYISSLEVWRLPTHGHLFMLLHHSSRLLSSAPFQHVSSLETRIFIWIWTSVVAISRLRNSQTEAVATHKMASTALLAHLARGSRPNIGICTILTRPMSWIIYVSGTACLRCGSLPSTTFCFAAPTTQAFRASCPAVSTMSVHIHETIF